MYIIETARLGLREWKEEDHVPFMEMNGDQRVMEYFPRLLSQEESMAMITRIKQFMKEHRFGLWAAERKDTHEFIGFTGFSIPAFVTNFTPCIEVGWRLAYRHWGNGFAPEAASACLNYAFHTLQLREILSFTAIPNQRSIRVMQKIGMHYVGQFNHPQIEEDSKLKRHVLYKTENPAIKPSFPGSLPPVA